MIAPHQQLSSMQGNPLLARNIDETVNNLKNLEVCIDQLRNDLVNVAEATGNLPAVHRLRTPASLAAASPAASASAWSPFDIQRQLASPLAQSAASPYGPHDPYETAMNPYSASIANQAATSPYAALQSPAAFQGAPWQHQQIQQPQIQQAQIQQARLAELARQGAIHPSQAVLNPYSQAAVTPFNQAAINPFSQAAISPFNQAAISPFSQAAISPYSQATVNPFNQAAVSPFSQAAVNPFSQAAVNPFSQAAVNPFSQAAISPYSQTMAPWSQAHTATSPQAISQRIPTIGAQNQLATQSPYAAAPNLSARQLSAPQISPGATVGPF